MLTFIFFLFLLSWKYVWASFFDLLIFLIPVCFLYGWATKRLKNNSKHSSSSCFLVIVKRLVSAWFIFFALMYSLGIGSVMAKFTGEYIYRNPGSLDFLYWASAWALTATALPLAWTVCFVKSCSRLLEKWIKSRLSFVLLVIPLLVLSLSFPILTSFSFYNGIKEYEKMSSGIENIDDWFEVKLHTYHNSGERPKYLKINKDALARSFVDEFNGHFEKASRSLGYETTSFSIEDSAYGTDDIDGKILVVQYNTKPSEEMPSDYLESYKKAAIEEQIQAIENCYSSENTRAMYDIFMRQIFNKIIFKDHEGSVLETFDVTSLSL